MTQLMGASWSRSSPYFVYPQTNAKPCPEVHASGSYPVLLVSTFTPYKFLFNIILQFKLPDALFPSDYQVLYALIIYPIFRSMMTNYEHRFLGQITKSFRHAIGSLGWGGGGSIRRKACRNTACRQRFDLSIWLLRCAQDGVIRTATGIASR
jgi:hypothetical protein